MRRSAILMALIFLFVPFTSMAATVDGSLNDWSSETHMGTDSNGISLHVDWDSSNLYLAWDGTDLSSPSEGADIFSILTQVKMDLLLQSHGMVSRHFHLLQIMG